MGARRIIPASHQLFLRLTGLSRWTRTFRRFISDLTEAEQVLSLNKPLEIRGAITEGCVKSEGCQQDEEQLLGVRLWFVAHACPRVTASFVLSPSNR